MVTSFPFLKIAREHDLPYGVVIRCVQALEDVDPKALREANTLIPADIRWVILEAFDNEYHRRQGKFKYD